MFKSPKPEALFEARKSFEAGISLDVLLYSGRVDDSIRIACSLLMARYDSWIHRKTLSNLLIMKSLIANSENEAVMDHLDQLSLDLNAAIKRGLDRAGDFGQAAQTLTVLSTISPASACDGLEELIQDPSFPRENYDSLFMGILPAYFRSGQLPLGAERMAGLEVGNRANLAKALSNQFEVGIRKLEGEDTIWKSSEVVELTHKVLSGKEEPQRLHELINQLVDENPAGLINPFGALTVPEEHGLSQKLGEPTIAMLDKLVDKAFSEWEKNHNFKLKRNIDASTGTSQTVNRIPRCPKCLGRDSYRQSMSMQKPALGLAGLFLRYTETFEIDICSKCDVEFVPRVLH